MKKLVLLALAMMMAPAAWAVNAGDLSAYIDGFVEARMAEHGVVGTTVSVVQDGRIVFAKGYGYDDLKKKRPVEARRSTFRPGSISKTLTWTAVMQLHERGLLDLEADIQTYLPDLELPKTFGKPITMLDLMAHQPGLEDTALGHLFEGNAEDVLPLLEYLQQHQPQQVREPGTLPSYSNFGVGVAGLIVANLSGETFEDYIDNNITGPLGMDSTTFREPGLNDERAMSDEMAEHVSKGYIRIGPDLQSSDFVYISQIAPAGGLSTTARDMAIWMLAHLGDGTYDGKQILTTESARLMHSQHRNLHPQLPGMAHGFIEADVHGYRGYGHGGGTVHFLSDLVILPELNLGIFISTNTTQAGSKLIQGFPRELVARYFPPGPNILVPIDDQDINTSAYLGTYIFTRRSHSTVEKINMPVAAIGAAEGNRLSLGQPPSPYQAVGEHLFQSVEQPDLKVAFYPGESGEIEGYYTQVPIMVAERAAALENPQIVYAWLGFAVLVFLSVLIGAWIRRRRTGPQTASERWAALMLYATSIVWVFAIGAIILSFVRILEDFRRVFFDFPSALFVNGLTLTLVATVLTAACVLMLRPVLTTPSWSGWRKTRHTLVVGVAVVTVYVLFQLNAIGYNYF